MATASFPALCEVAIICGDGHCLSQVYPAAVPVVSYIDAARDSLNEELKTRGLEPLPAGDYELTRIDGERLDTARTLQALGVVSGQTLVLVPACANGAASYEPQYEALSSGLAQIGKTLIPKVTAMTAVTTALGLMALAVAAITAMALRARAGTDSLIVAVTCGAGGLLLVVSAAITARWWPSQTRLVDGLAWQGAVLAAVAAYTAAPGQLGAPHLLLAAATATVAAVGTARLTRRHATAATVVITVCAVAAVSVGLRMWRPVPGQWLGMLTLLVLLLGVFNAPIAALRACGVRPPLFGSITGRDVFARLRDMAVDTVAAVDDTDQDPTPTGAQIAAAVRRVHAVLTGQCIGLAAVLPAAVWAALVPGRDKAWAAALVSALMVVIFVSRGRATFFAPSTRRAASRHAGTDDDDEATTGSFVGWQQAVPLVVGAAVATVAGVVKYVAQQPASNTGVFAVAASGVFMLGVTALLAAAVIPASRFTPLVRLSVEWVEIAAIVAVVPLIAWTVGLFSWVRLG
jgi:type VII secretion integral membrane protein EccD